MAVNSVAHQAVAHKRLLASLRAAGVAGAAVHVFIGGSARAPRGYDPLPAGATAHHVAFNSIDFTGLVALCDRPALLGRHRHWMYLHGTAEVDRNFTALLGELRARCERGRAPRTQRLCPRYGMNMGVYASADLWPPGGAPAGCRRVLPLRNMSKAAAVRLEDAVFNSIAASPRDARPLAYAAPTARGYPHGIYCGEARGVSRPYGGAYRAAVYYPPTGLLKWKANTQASAAHGGRRGEGYVVEA